MTVEDKIAELELALEALKDELLAKDEDNYIEDNDIEEDVTDECIAEIGHGDGGGIRMYLTHEGNVITRAGMGKVLELTSYAEGAGYQLVPTDQSTLRGSYFRVLKN